MKRIVLLIVCLAILAACSKTAEVKFINRTKAKVYFTAKGKNYVMPAATEATKPTITVEVDCGDRFFIYDDWAKKLEITNFYGELFALVPNNLTVTSTKTEVKPDKTRSMYINPTHAGLKVINNGNKTVNLIEINIKKPDGTINPVEFDFTGTLNNGDEFWMRLPYSTSSSSFTYIFTVGFDDGTTIEKRSILELGDQEIIEVN